jgi:hypothetical protein
MNRRGFLKGLLAGALVPFVPAVRVERYSKLWRALKCPECPLSSCYGRCPRRPGYDPNDFWAGCYWDPKQRRMYTWRGCWKAEDYLKLEVSPSPSVPMGFAELQATVEEVMEWK